MLLVFITKKRKKWVHDESKVLVWASGKMELWFTKMGMTKREVSSGESENKN